MVDSSDRRSRYKTRSLDARAAKFFPCWADRTTSSRHSRSREITSSSFRLATPPRLEPLDVEGEKEFIVELIVNEKGKGRTQRYLVK
ncbi:hypothetical protein RTG_00710 [Rhodotorula toruloides ATCC 204091]|nr:hypothetical protein RTG_00710 [Rhodotorula toruloides ATCC 204091]